MTLIKVDYFLRVFGNFQIFFWLFRTTLISCLLSVILRRTFERINKHLSLEIINIRGNWSLFIRPNLLSIRSEIWRRFPGIFPSRLLYRKFLESSCLDVQNFTKEMHEMSTKSCSNWTFNNSSNNNKISNKETRVSLGPRVSIVDSERCINWLG